MSAEIRSEMQRLNKKQLLGVCRVLFLPIANIVTTSPINPITRKIPTITVIVKLDSVVVGSWHSTDAEKAKNTLCHQSNSKILSNNNPLLKFID